MQVSFKRQAKQICNKISAKQPFKLDQLLRDFIGKTRNDW